MEGYAIAVEMLDEESKIVNKVSTDVAKVDLHNYYDSG